MRTPSAIIATLAIVLSACSSSGSRSAAPATDAATSTTAAPRIVDQRPFAFDVRHETFVDTSRTTATPGNAAFSPNRSLPTDLYVPKVSRPLPLILFSHGYHGNPSKFSELFSAWATAGYIVAAPQFPLTSTRGAPYDILTDYVEQPADIRFVLDQLLAGSLRNVIDTERIAAAGLSLGGATTYGLVYNECCREPRLRAAAIFDGVRLAFEKPYVRNRIPVLIAHIDTDIAAPYKVAKQAYDDSASPKWLLTLHGGIHPEAYENTPSKHDATATATSIDFFDLTVLGDTAARDRLERDGTNSGESTIVSG